MSARNRSLAAAPRRGVIARTCACSALVLLASAPTVRASEFEPPKQVGAYFGYDDHTNILGVELTWDSPWQSEALASRSLVPKFDAAIAAWRARDRSSQHADLVSIGGNAILRYAPAGAEELRPFVDGALGIQFLTHTRINNRDLGASFQVGSMVAAGFSFGRDNAHELSAFVQHVSNGRTATFNDGFTYLGICLRSALR
jgi:hypothetical protein